MQKNKLIIYGTRPVQEKCVGKLASYMTSTVLTGQLNSKPTKGSWPRWLSWMRRPTGDRRSRVRPRRGRQHSFVEIDHEIFSTVILSLPLIQEGQLSVSGERMCTILVNRLEDSCPVNMWLGKLTALDMTPLG